MTCLTRFITTVNSHRSNASKSSRNVYKCPLPPGHPNPTSPAPALHSHSPPRHARRNPNPTIAPLPLRCCWIWPSRHALLTASHRTGRRTSSSLANLAPLPCTLSSRHRAPRRVIASSTPHPTHAHLHLVVMASSGSINDNLHHCGFVLDDENDNAKADGNGNGGPNTPTSAPPPPIRGSPTPSTVSTNTGAGGAA
jgi:hypothetical protein